MLLSFKAEALTMPLKRPLRVATGTDNEVLSVVVRLAGEGVEAIGESAPDHRYGESVDSVLTYYRMHAPQIRSAYAFEPALRDSPLAARCGLDIAMHDFIAKLAGVPLCEWLGLDARETPRTSVTIGIDGLGAMLERVRELAHLPILKIKLGTAYDIELVAAIRATYTGTLRVDANEGWDPELAVSRLRELSPYGIEFCEQPIPTGHSERLRWIRERFDDPDCCRRRRRR